jgi:hypothetical protein
MIEPLIIKSAQKQAPDVEFDAYSGVLSMSGQCYVDNAEKFFRPLFDWLEQYLREPGRTILFEMQLDYFNTSSAKCLWEIFLRLEHYVRDRQGHVVVQWHFNEDDENTRDLFEDFRTEVNLPFIHVNTSW